MFNQIKQAAWFFAIGAVGLAGCTQGNTVNTAAPPPAAVLNPGVPQTPEAAVNTVLDGLKASKPIVVWDAMTAAQQSAFNQIVRDFATAADPEIWKQTVVNLKKAAQLAETKKQFILQSPLVRSVKQIKSEDVKAAWDPGLKLFKTVLESELVDQDKMKNFDGHAFLEGTGATLLAQAREISRTFKGDPLKQIDSWTATVETLPDHSAKATLHLGGERSEPMEIPLKIQEGKWTSDRLGFLQFLVGGRLDPIAVRFRPYWLLDWKDKYLADMRRIGKALDQLQAAKTPDDFQSVVSLQVLPFVVQKTLEFSQRPKPLTPLEAQSQGRPKDTVMILIKGDHFADEPGMLELLKLGRTTAAQGNGMFSGPFQVEQMSLFMINPVSDADAFAKQIHIGKITKIEKKRNKIFIELPPAAPDDKSTANADGASQARP